MTLDQFRKRPMEVTVSEHCEHCKTLKPETMQKRDILTYSDAGSAKYTMTSCYACYRDKVDEMTQSCIADEI